MDFEKCGIETVVPLTTDDKTDISTPFGPDLQQFTEQQIEDYCKMAENVCLGRKSKGSWMVRSVQIIRQLQGQLTTTQPEIVDSAASSEA